MKNKTLLYLASGEIYEDYCKLPFKKMIFVDRQNQDISFQDDRINFIRADALFAIEQSRNNKIKIDYLVSINEGILEGGGNYPVLSDFMLGYMSPILSDEFFLIYDPSYYRSLYMNLNPEWGFKKTVVNSEDPGYIFPSMFSYQYLGRRKKT